MSDYQAHKVHDHLPGCISCKAIDAEIARLRAEVEWLRGTTGHTEDCPKADAVVRAAEVINAWAESQNVPQVGMPFGVLQKALAAYRKRA